MDVTSAERSLSPASPAISFIVPAHNEEAVLGQTLQAIHDSAPKGELYEIIVVDDASTDATADIAKQHNARVVSVNHRQIAATRNSGGRAARGERLFFIDADTVINPRAVASAMRAMDKGAVGGGAPVAVEGIVPLYIRLIAFLSPLLAKIAGFTGGAFMFCTRAAFQATGGFNERLYWGEEGAFAQALKRQGRFVAIWPRVLTSGRRFRKTSALELAAGVVRLYLSPRKMFTERKSVEKLWYDSNRADDDKMPDSLVVRLSNGIAFLLLVLLLTGWVWGFIPWSATPLSSLPGKIRFLIAMFLCHTGMLVLWPAAIVLLASIWRQKTREFIRSAALIAFCVWQAWGATHGVIALWTTIFSWGA